MFELPAELITEVISVLTHALQVLTLCTKVFSDTFCSVGYSTHPPTCSPRPLLLPCCQAGHQLMPIFVSSLTAVGLWSFVNETSAVLPPNSSPK